jgi:hypothetical protein
VSKLANGRSIDVFTKPISAMVLDCAVSTEAATPGLHETLALEFSRRCWGRGFRWDTISV